MCFFISAEQAYLEKDEPFSTFKTMISSYGSFEKLSQFSTERMC
jgi:hypothetical protein